MINEELKTMRDKHVKLEGNNKENVKENKNSRQKNRTLTVTFKKKMTN